MIFERLKSFLKNDVGATMIVFAIAIPAILGTVGMAVDLSSAYMVKKRLGKAIDAAALAAAGSGGNEDVVEDRMEAYFYKNYPESYPGTPHDLVMGVTDEELVISASATLDTHFMRILGVDEITVSASVTVVREVRGIEVVMVLDNTGSMSSYNNISALRTAAGNFVDILFERAPDDESIKIGLVPFSTSVNVGPYGIGENLDGSYYGESFVNNPQELDYNTGSSSEWGGCVLAYDNPEDTQDHDGPWDMYRWCREVDDDYPVCDYSYSWWTGERSPRRSANYICPDSPIVPLTSDQDFLNDQIDGMDADGHTLGNYGMAWGVRVISPEFPFEEGAEWTDEKWRKAMVMMTDGENTMNGTFSAYGRTSDHSIRTSELNSRLANVCENAKDLGIIVYTVTFTSGIGASTKDIFKNCASDSTKYHDAPLQDDLIEAFEAISRELSNLHIKN